MLAAATCQDQSGKEKCRLARCELNGLAISGTYFKSAKQPDVHISSPDLDSAKRIAPSPADLTRI